MNQQFPKTPFEPTRGPIRFMPGSADAAGLPQTAGLPASLTYEPYYLLKEKPFSLSADPRFLYRSPAHAPAFEELLTGIRRREGLIVLTGEIGTGKTTLIRSVLQQLDRRTFTAFVPDPFVSREDLLKMLLVDFGVVSLTDLKRGSLAGASRPDLSYPLYEFLDSLVPLQAFAVLIIDEAQNLPLPLLEEIRILSDLEQREKLLQVVLVGQPELRSHLKMPEMRQVDQRVSVRCELSALSRDDISEYVKHRLTVAGGGESRVEFSASAIDAIFTASSGVPRVINLICDRALQRGHLAHATRIDADLIEEAVDVLGLERPSATSAPSAPPAHSARSAPSAPSTPSTPSTPTPLSPVAVAQAVQPSSVPVASNSPQFLAEFAAESELSSRQGRRLGIWRLAASLLLAALSAAGIAAYWYIYLTSATIDVSAATPPPSPQWTLATPAPAPPSIDVVSVDAGPARSQTTLAAPAGASGLFAIQVASFESRERADRLVNELVSAGFRARIVEFDLGTRNPLLQIRVDGYSSSQDAGPDLVRIREIPGYADARLVAN